MDIELAASCSSPKMVIVSTILLIFFLYTLFWVFSRTSLFCSRYRNKKLQPPPVAVGARPIIGHLHLLTGPEPAHKTLAKMADSNGPLFTLKLGMHKAVVVSNWEIAKECFKTNDRAFSSRPKLTAAKHMGYNNSLFGLAQYGPFWRHIRKIASLELLSAHRLHQFQPIRTSEIQSSINKLYKLCAEEKTLVEMKTWFEDLTLNIMVEIVFGKRFSDALEGDRDFQKMFRDLMELFGIFVPADSFPFLSWLDLGGYEKAMKKASKVVDEVFDKWLSEHREKKMESNSDKTEDFMDVMISVVEDDDDEQLFGYDGDSVIKATCLAIVLAGFDTTATTMTWALSLLLNNQETLKKAQLELEQKVGTSQKHVTESDVKQLTYLQAIVKEVLRLYPAAPLSLPRQSIEDCSIFGYHIPSKTRLIVNLQKLQRDPLVWKEPNEFRPERFLTTQKDVDVRGQSPQLIPFGSGRRICPGVSFALQIIHLTLANLLHGFEVDRPSKDLLDMEESSGLTSTKKTPLEVVLAPRLPTQVYV